MKNPKRHGPDRPLQASIRSTPGDAQSFFTPTTSAAKPSISSWPITSSCSRAMAARPPTLVSMSTRSTYNPYSPYPGPCLNPGRKDFATAADGQLEYLKRLQRYFRDQLGLPMSGNPYPYKTLSKPPLNGALRPLLQRERQSHHQPCFGLWGHSPRPCCRHLAKQ